MNAPHVRRVARTLHGLDEMARDRVFLEMNERDSRLLVLHTIADLNDQVVQLRTDFEEHAKRPRGRTKRAAAAVGGALAGAVGGFVAWRANA